MARYPARWLQDDDARGKQGEPITGENQVPAVEAPR
jgi:hypothetical protein